MLSLRSAFVPAVVLLGLVALPACGLIDKLKGKGADAGDGDAAVADAAVAVEVPDAAPVADAAVAAATPTASPPIVGACKPGDLADCTTKCQTQKNQSSCVNLGLMFASGQGVAQDNNKAATLFQGACAGNVGSGCERFGVALHNGLGIQADLPRAADTFKKGCDLRSASACNQLALMNVRGEGGPKDTVKAVAGFQKACDLGDAFGCGNLANHLASGDGIARDPARAAALRKSACDKGDQQACRALAANDGGAPPSNVATAPSGASSATPTAADCVTLKKVFMDTCQDSCASKLKAQNIKKNDAECRLFCEGGCASQMFNSPTMAKCKGK
jgi:TPR repeat protein